MVAAMEALSRASAVGESMSAKTRVAVYMHISRIAPISARIRFNLFIVMLLVVMLR